MCFSEWSFLVSLLPLFLFNLISWCFSSLLARAQFLSKRLVSALGGWCVLGDRRHVLLPLLFPPPPPPSSMSTTGYFFGHNGIMCRIDIQLYGSRVGTAPLFSMLLWQACQSRLWGTGWTQIYADLQNWSSIVRLFCAQEALQTPLYWRTHWVTCSSWVITQMSRQSLLFNGPHSGEIDSFSKLKQIWKLIWLFTYIMRNIL